MDLWIVKSEINAKKDPKLTNELLNIGYFFKIGVQRSLIISTICRSKQQLIKSKIQRSLIIGCNIIQSIKTALGNSTGVVFLLL